MWLISQLVLGLPVSLYDIYFKQNKLLNNFGLHVDVNRHPLSSCELHRAIDARFSASSFGKHVGKSIIFPSKSHVCRLYKKAFDEVGETRSPRPSKFCRHFQKTLLFML